MEYLTRALFEKQLTALHVVHTFHLFNRYVFILLTTMRTETKTVPSTSYMFNVQGCTHADFHICAIYCYQLTRGTGEFLQGKCDNEIVESIVFDVMTNEAAEKSSDEVFLNKYLSLRFLQKGFFFTKKLWPINKYSSFTEVSNAVILFYLVIRSQTPVFLFVDHGISTDYK